MSEQSVNDQGLYGPYNVIYISDEYVSVRAFNSFNEAKSFIESMTVNAAIVQGHVLEVWNDR